MGSIKKTEEPFAEFAERIRKAINDSVCIPTDREQARNDNFKPCSEKQAAFIKSMASFLVKNYKRPNQKSPDIIARLAQEPAIESTVYTNPDFQRAIGNALSSPDTGKHIWLEEIDHPGLMADIVRIYCAYLNDTENSKDVNYSPSTTHNKHYITSDGVCIYKSSPTPAEWAVNYEHSFEPVNSALSAKDNRPKIFYFGGSFAEEETTDHIRKNFRRIHATLSSETTSPADYDLYNVTYNNHDYMDKWRSSMDFSHSPATYASKEAVAFVEQFLRPLYAKGKGKSATAGYSEEELKHRFSLVTFVGYSYGGTFAEEVCNAMAQDMQKIGYDKRIIENAMPHIASFALASSGKVEQDKPQAFTRVHANTREDDISQGRSNIQYLVAKDRSKQVRQFRVPSKKGLSLLALELNNTPQKIPFYPPSKTISHMGFSRGTFAVKDGEGIERRFEEKPAFELENPEYHHIGGFLTTTGIRHCDGLFSVAPNPGTQFISACLRAQVEASVKAAKKPDGKRNAEGIMAELAERTLSPEALRMIAAENNKYQKLLGQEKSSAAARF